MLYNKYLIRINYKSGIQEQLWCTNYDFKYDENEITSYSLSGLNKNRPIALVLSNVESVWFVKRRRGIFGIMKS